MKRVTFATPNASGTYKDESNNRYKVSSGMYTDEQISLMTNTWTPQLEADELVLGSQASPSSTVGVCYHNIDQALQWLGLINA